MVLSKQWHACLDTVSKRYTSMCCLCRSHRQATGISHVRRMFSKSSRLALLKTPDSSAWTAHKQSLSLSIDEPASVEPDLSPTRVFGSIVRYMKVESRNRIAYQGQRHWCDDTSGSVWQSRGSTVIGVQVRIGYQDKALRGGNQDKPIQS